MRSLRAEVVTPESRQSSKPASLPLTDPPERSRAVAQLLRETAELRAEVSSLRAQRRSLAKLAYVDPLTGLGNRRAFDRHLEREWALTHRHRRDSFVVVADLDDFKQLNDSRGHAAGDQALCQFAEALRVAARSTDILTRIGGDEFGVLLTCCEEQAAHSFEARLRDTLRAPRASFGHASLQESATRAEAFKRADLAMLARKLPRTEDAHTVALRSEGDTAGKTQ